MYDRIIRQVNTPNIKLIPLLWHNTHCSEDRKGNLRILILALEFHKL